MRLDSVLALKEELSHEVPMRIAAALALEQAGARHLRSARAPAPPSGLENRRALGVSAGGRHADYRLAVRLIGPRARAEREAEKLKRKTKGEIDVRFVERIRARTSPRPSWLQKLRRPLEPGLSIGHPRITAGTLGAFVESATPDGGEVYILSNNHVLANVNRAQAGDAALQPGPLDIDRATKPRHVVGTVDRFMPFSLRGINTVDCALAALQAGMEYCPRWNAAIQGNVRAVRPISVDDLGRKVCKVGRTTGVTFGIVSAVELDRVMVDMGTTRKPLVLRFDDQFEVQDTDGSAFSLGGDSGSAILDTQGNVRGLLFAGGPDESGIDLTYANQMVNVTEKLGVKLAEL